VESTILKKNERIEEDRAASELHGKTEKQVEREMPEKEEVKGR